MLIIGCDTEKSAGTDNTEYYIHTFVIVGSFCKMASILITQINPGSKCSQPILTIVTKGEIPRRFI